MRRKRKEPCTSNGHQWIVLSLARQGLNSTPPSYSARPTENETPWAVGGQAHRVRRRCDEEPDRQVPRRRLIGSAAESPHRPPPSELTVDRASPSRSAPAQAIWMVRSGQVSVLPSPEGGASLCFQMDHFAVVSQCGLPPAVH